MWTDELYATLDQRVLPEHVASIIRDGGVTWPREIQLRLGRVASALSPWYVSSMSSDFERADDCAAQLAAAGRMFGVSVSGIDPADVSQVRDFVTAMGRRVNGWEPGMDWKRDRLTREQRAESYRYPDVSPRLMASKRQYNRHVRVLRHLWDKAERMGSMQHQRDLVLTGRSGFASRITRERFAADPVTACFIAYYIARKNKRRMFTLASRENPVDHLAEALLAAAMAQPGTDWEMLAWVYPRPQVLARLAPRQLGDLLGSWHAVLASTAAELERAWPGDDAVNRLTMVVRRGMDSSSWNIMAQAYNAARDGWIGCVAASGALALLEPACPGKVMRLMAADLVRWHSSSGGDVDPATTVWGRLPLPWQVLQGTHPCTGADVREACAEAGLDAARSGWTAPRADGAPAEFRPTPDLVHGIAVADPAWAALLRRAGVFSGKRIKDGYRGEVAKVPPEVITGPRPVYDLATGKYAGTTTSEEG
jgi:hypothetical protein